MKPRAQKIINRLARKVTKLKPPIHIIAICSGGKTVGECTLNYLKSKNIESSYYEVWTNIINGKAKIWKTNFYKKDYKGTVLIVEDVIWKGTAVKAVRKYLYGMKKKKVYSAVLLDYNHKADFSVFH